MNTENTKQLVINIKAIESYLLFFVGISGCFSVLFGAWLAHNSSGFDLDQQSSMATAIEYQFIHTLALLLTLLWLKVTDESIIILMASVFFVFGIVFFSGTIYIKNLLEFQLIGKLTPLGGISFAIGWLLLAIQGKKKL